MPSTPSRQLNLNLFVYPAGHHEAALALPRLVAGADPRHRPTTRSSPRRAEAAKFDAVFFADGPALADNIRYAPGSASSRSPGCPPSPRSTTHRPDRDRVDHVLRALQPGAAVRLAGPHQRRPRRLEHRHHAVRRARRRTSASTSIPTHDERYDRAQEFVDVVTQAVGQLGGRRGRRGPRRRACSPTPTRSTRSTTSAGTSGSGARSTSPRSPQGRPVYVQAGSSDDGRAFAARYAEAIFTAHQTLGERAGVLRRHQAPGRSASAATPTR